MDPPIQWFMHSAKGDRGQEDHAAGFSFHSAARRNVNYSLPPASNMNHSEPPTSREQTQVPFAPSQTFQPIERTASPPLNDQTMFDSPGRAYYEHFSNVPFQPPQTALPGRMSLAPRRIYNQQTQFGQLKAEPRVVRNTDNHFRFTQNLRAGLPINGVPARPLPAQRQKSGTIDQLATAMVLGRQMPQVTFQSEPKNIFQERARAQIPNVLQSQKQQITPPFHGMGDYVHKPGVSPASTSCSSYGPQSSPTARVTMRRAVARITPTSLELPARQNLKSQVFLPPRSPQHQTVQLVKQTTHQTLALGHAPPMAHGIQLLSPHELGDRFRSVFPYELFNAVQSKCFAPIYKSNNNIVVAAPTGSGKTALLELAICRAIEANGSGNFKIVYQAPTKSLCAERLADWSKKFSHLNLECAELTGDTGPKEMARVRNASIIVTTPEKWDSITRKWSDHHKLVQMVKLFLIDEVHILKEVRGATLEVVVSRMKSMGADVRFVALSATIPNSEDIAVWLGRDHCTQQLPAHRETFDETFRPVKLQKHVYGYEGKMNDFMFEKFLDGKLPGLIRKHTQKKPMMIFCFTRKSCETTAQKLAEWWFGQMAEERAWPPPKQHVAVTGKELQDIVGCGVAFHHAGLEAQDRHAIESAFLGGNIGVICCTSTLAVGVNLPCHLVILKGTTTFSNNMPSELSDLEVMQMLGRAGRPQFEDTAVAIIMTRAEKKDHYDKMISGADILESSLHLNLIEYLNSEIGLRTINSLDSAKSWLEGTFLSVRMRLNPGYYRIDNIVQGGDTDRRLKLVCERDIKLLQDHVLVTSGNVLDCTEYGKAMSRYMVAFETMKLLLSIPEHAKTEIILKTMCQAVEFRDLRIKPNQRPCLREINKSAMIKFPIHETISTTTHKILLLIQMELGGIEHPTDKDFAVLRKQFSMEKNIILKRVNRLIRCIIDCKSVDCDAISTRHALELARSFSAGFWENSNLQLRQVPMVGPALHRKLLNNNINSIEKLAGLDTASIERSVGKNPPFGKTMQQTLLGFPRLTCSAELIGQAVKKTGRKPKVTVRARLGFSNLKTPVWRDRMPFLTFMAETSEGVLVHFWRGAIYQLEKGYDFSFTAELSTVNDYIFCRLACDDIIGTQHMAVLKHNIPASDFPSLPKISDKQVAPPARKRSLDEFGIDDIKDEELLDAAVRAEKRADEGDFIDVDDLFDDRSTIVADFKKPVASKAKALPVLQMSNGKYACNHSCRDGALGKNGQPCKHRCCKEGLDKPSKRNARTSSGVSGQQQIKADLVRSPDSPSVPKMKIRNSKLATNHNDLKLKLKKDNPDKTEDDNMEVIDLAEGYSATFYSDLATRDYRKLHNLHMSFQQDEAIRLATQKPQYEYNNGKPLQLSFASDTINDKDENLFGSMDIDDEDFPSPSAIFGGARSITSNFPSPPTIRQHKVYPRTESQPPSAYGLEDDHDPFEEGGVIHQAKRFTPSFQGNSMDHDYAAGMLELSDPTLAPAPILTNSFGDGVFDFEALSDNARSHDSTLSLSAYHPTQCQVSARRRAQLPLKRAHSPTPELEPAEVRYKRVMKENVAKETAQSSESLEPSLPDWLIEFDDELINGLKDIVDFV